MLTDELKNELSEPITEEAFCGRYLKADRAVFRPLRNSFNLAQTSLRKLSHNPDGSELERLQEENYQNWFNLSSDLISIFRHSSRDIELIGWFISGQLFTDTSGQSFANAFEWLTFLIEKHWNSLHPVLPENKLKTTTTEEQLVEQAQAKLKALVQLLGDSEESSLLYAPFLMYPLIGNITFFQYQSAERKGQLSILKQQAAIELPHEAMLVKTKLDNFEKALSSISKLQDTLSGKAKTYAISIPSFRFVKKLITGVRWAISYLTGIDIETKTTEVAQASELTDVPENIEQMVVLPEIQPVNEMGMQNTILSSSVQDLLQTAATNSMNRNIAFHRLREIANYFRESEPHSPVSFLLEKAIRWGGMTLPELLTEMVTEPDGDLLNRIFNTAGLDHSEQISLPTIAQASQSIKPVSDGTTRENKQSVAKSEVPVSAEKPADTNLKQKTNKKSSTGSTALSW